MKSCRAEWEADLQNAAGLQCTTLLPGTSGNQHLNIQNITPPAGVIKASNQLEIIIKLIKQKTITNCSKRRERMGRLLRKPKYLWCINYLVHVFPDETAAGARCDERIHAGADPDRAAAFTSRAIC